MEDKQQNPKIVILGGGFGGVNTAVLLSRKLGKKATIVLVSQNDYHLYYPNLYEVATSEEEFTSIADLKHSIALPLKKILPPSVQVMQGEVKNIDRELKVVQLQSGQGIAFDYLVIALGATTDFFNVPGLQENSLTLKSLAGALRIRNGMEFAVESHRLDLSKKLLRVIVGGGGFSGVELAGELVKLVKILSWKYNYPSEKIELLIVEGTSQLLPGMPANISRAVLERLKGLNVQIKLGNFISKADKNQIVLNNNEAINYDLLIWTGGARSVKVPFVQAAVGKSAIQNDAKDRLFVTPFLEVQGCENIFALGDNAAVLDENKKPLPGTATQAIAQAEYLAKIIVAKIKNENLNNNSLGLRPYKSAAQSYIIPVSGKWAVLHWGPLNLDIYGFIGWLAHRYADFRYFHGLMPAGLALRLACFDARLYSRHD